MTPRSSGNVESLCVVKAGFSGRIASRNRLWIGGAADVAGLLFGRRVETERLEVCLRRSRRCCWMTSRRISSGRAARKSGDMSSVFVSSSLGIDLGAALLDRGMKLDWVKVEFESP